MFIARTMAAVDMARHNRTYAAYDPRMACEINSDILYVPAAAFGHWVYLARIFGAQNGNWRFQDGIGYNRTLGVYNEYARCVRTPARQGLESLILLLWCLSSGTIIGIILEAMPELKASLQRSIGCRMNCCSLPFAAEDMPIAVRSFPCGHKIDLRDEATVSSLKAVWTSAATLVGWRRNHPKDSLNNTNI